MKKVFLIVGAIILITIIIIYFSKDIKTSTYLENNQRNSFIKVTEEKVSNDNNINYRSSKSQEEKRDSTETATVQEIEKIENNEEKAIEIVKKDCKDLNAVGYNIEGIDNAGKYIIAVRDNEGNALYWYTVNIETETFEIENAGR